MPMKSIAKTFARGEMTCNETTICNSTGWKQFPGLKEIKMAELYSKVYFCSRSLLRYNLLEASG